MVIADMPKINAALHATVKLSVGLRDELRRPQTSPEFPSTKHTESSTYDQTTFVRNTYNFEIAVQTLAANFNSTSLGTLEAGYVDCRLCSTKCTHPVASRLRRGNRMLVLFGG
jgi:hypothetical protein